MLSNAPASAASEGKSPRIVIDGLFFQIAKTGIARLWKSHLEQWAKTDFASHLIVLDRARTAPRIPGITYQDVPSYDGGRSASEALQIEKWCQEFKVDLFISTFYSSPIQTRSVMMVYDMIYELLSGGKKESWQEEEKSLAILHASHIVAISHNTAKDVQTFFPHTTESDFSVVHCGVDPVFAPASVERIAAAREKYGLTKPFFLFVGIRKGFNGYKNAIFLVRALSKMKEAADFEIACVGGEATLEELAGFKNVSVRRLPHVSEDDLISLYSGAEALVYPSRYEGFGLPILEAMACGCPVITCANGSIPEVAGDAAIFVENDNDEEMRAALLQVGDPLFRAKVQADGFARVHLFSWEKAAAQLAQILLWAATLPQKLPREACIWQTLREQESRLEPLAHAGRKLSKRRVRMKMGQYHFQLSAYRE